MESVSVKLGNVVQEGQKIIQNKGFDIPSNKLALLFFFTALFNLPLLLFVIAYFPAWAKYSVSFLITIRMLNCFAQITHTGGHGTLFKSRKANDFAAFFSSFIMGYQPQGMWLTHSDHHHFLNTEKDGDRSWGEPNQSFSNLLKGLLSDLTGSVAFNRALHYFLRQTSKTTSRINKRQVFELLIIVLVQLILYSFFYLSDGPIAYFIFYAVPLATLYPAQARLRSFVEHHVEEEQLSDKKNLWFARSTKPRILETLVLAPFGQNYHLEHHLFPTVPGYYLKQLHGELFSKVNLSPCMNSSYLHYWVVSFTQELRELKRFNKKIKQEA